MKELTAIFQNIKEEFCSLWTFKERGQTLEIITPYVTTTNKFVSVFLTFQQQFVVSDGGWLSDQTYESELPFEDDSFERAFAYYVNFYGINSTKARGNDFYFKKTDKKELIPNLVFDIANFVSAVSSCAQIQFVDIKEKEEKERFNKQANNFLSSLIPKSDKKNIQFRKPVSDQLKSIRFSAIATENNKLTLVNYITGSTPEYFIGSIGKANITFEVVSKSTMKEHVRKNIALINDQATGFNKSKLYAYLEQLGNTTKNNNVLWNERDKLKTLI